MRAVSRLARPFLILTLTGSTTISSSSRGVGDRDALNCPLYRDRDSRGEPAIPSRQGHAPLQRKAPPAEACSSPRSESLEKRPSGMGEIIERIAQS